MHRFPTTEAEIADRPVAGDLQTRFREEPAPNARAGGPTFGCLRARCQASA